MRNEFVCFQRIVWSNFARLSFPYKITFAVTYRCNLRCEMCLIWKGRSSEELRLSEIEEFFCRNNSFSWIALTGGEPFMREDIHLISKAIFERCRSLYALQITTNGTLTERIIPAIEDIVRNKPKRLRVFINVSIDGPSALHDAMRGVEGSWMRAMRTLKALFTYRSIKTRIAVTLSQRNSQAFQPTVKSLAEVFPSIRQDDFSINFFQKSSFFYQNERIPPVDKQDMMRAVKDILAGTGRNTGIHSLLKRKYLSGYQYFMHNKIVPLKCQALSSSCMISPTGEVYPCTVFNVPVAHLRDENYDLRRIWNQVSVKKVYVQCARGDCPRCWSPCEAYTMMGGSLLNYDLWRM